MSGFELIDVLPSSRLVFSSLGSSVPLEEQSNCPACTEQLTVVCELSGTESRMRVGVCARCGYLGLIDRPTKEWIVEFYSRFWDKDFVKSLEQVKRDATLSSGAVKSSRRWAIDTYKKLPVDPHRPLLDVGCGYGEVLKNFEREGFSDLTGVENTPHRAALVREAFGYPVFDGDFGSEAMTAKLIGKAPYGLVFSHHVLEHTFDPGAVIAAIARLQEEGDSLILALPNSTGEHILYGALYLAHLHGFTKESLELLLNRHGYEVRADSSPDDTNIIVGAVKTTNPKPRFTLRNDYVERTVRRMGKLTAGVPAGAYAELYWEQRLDSLDWSVARPVSGSALYRLGWRLRSAIAYCKSRWFGRVTAGYTMLVRAIEVPLSTIKYSGPIKIFLK